MYLQIIIIIHLLIHLLECFNYLHLPPLAANKIIERGRMKREEEEEEYGEEEEEEEK